MSLDDETQAEQMALFDDVERVVADPLRFKIKLGIGSDAYLTLKIGKRLQNLWDVGGVGAAGAGLAASPMVAGTFFASGGWLSAIGLGAAAVTPIGRIAAAAVGSAAAYYGVTRLFSSYGASRVIEVPNFINTPIDILGTRMVDLIAPLAIRVARIDNDYDIREHAAIRNYFVKEWGIDSAYAEAALATIEKNADDIALNDLVSALADFQKSNPDCNYDVICRDILRFLREVAEADHRIDEREEMAIERIEKLLRAKGRLTMSDLLGRVKRY